MSFLVSFNGQFKNYKLPDLSHFDGVHRVTQAATSSKVEDSEPLNAQTSKGNSQKLSSYQSVEKAHDQHKKFYYAKDIYSHPIITLETNDSIEALHQCMRKHHFLHIPILDKGVLVGIVSDRDLLTRTGLLITDIMTNEVLVAHENTRIQDIARIMLHEGFSALPIVNDQNILTGIVTQTDLLNFVTRLSPLMDHI